MARAHWSWSFALCAPFLLAGSSARAQTVDNIRWVTNGSVFAVAHHDGITYVGGQFSIVSPPSGAGVAINAGNGVVPGGYPWVVGRVFTAVGDGSGGWYLGGIFTSVGGQPRNNVAHLGSDLSVTAWNPNANGAVLAMQITTLGTVYAGGDFTSIGGQARNRLAELDASGNATAMNANLNSTVRALASSGSTMYVGGDFTFAGGGTLSRNRLLAIDVNTRTTTTWNPGCNGSVFALEVAFRPGASILVGGSFSSVGGQLRNNLAELSTAGVATAWNPSPNGTVRDIQERTVDYIGGDFTTIGGGPRNYLAAISPTTGLANAWDPNIDGPVECLVWSSSNVFVGGRFENVGGVPRRNVAKIDESTGIPAAWNPQPNGLVRTVYPGGSGKIYAGGDFTGLGGVKRNNLAAIEDASASVTSWNPDADAPVYALALRVFGPTLYTVYAGGDFIQVGGQPRGHVAAIHPTSGIPTSWVTNTDFGVRALVTNDSMVVFGGSFDVVDGQTHNSVAAKRHTGGNVIGFSGLSGTSNVFALAMSSSYLHVGADFGFARFGLANQNLVSFQSPAANGSVRALRVKGSTVYAGGDFTTVGGQPRSRLASVSTSDVVNPWNPGADGIVRAIVQGELGLLVGGDFANAGGSPRARLAWIDQTTGLAQTQNASIEDREVWALASSGPYVYLGGTFHGMSGVPQAGTARVGDLVATICAPPPASYAGSRPRGLAVLDADDNGILDLAACSPGFYPRINLLLGLGSSGVGNGSFGIGQTVTLTAPPMAVVAADFDLDGRDDLAVSTSADVGTVELFRNVAGTFQPWVTVPLPGRSDGLTAGDYDADGILDLVVCLTDSASTIRRGGVQFIRGGGTGGVWDGTFTLERKAPRPDMEALPRRILAHDFNQDGWADFAYTGSTTGGPYFVHMGPGLVPTCYVGGFVLGTPPGNSGTALAAGDFNEDGRTDLVTAGGRNLRVQFKNTDITGCSVWFPNSTSLLFPLPSTPRDLAVMDLNQDGILDIVCAFDSLVATLAVCYGQGSGDVGDGTFAPATYLATHEIYGLALADFVEDGITDIASSMPECGQVAVLSNTTPPMFPVTITLTSPNGGEGWSEAARIAPPLESSAGVVTEFETDSGDPPAQTASLQAISWSKGAGVHGVDVEISRNDGLTWREIAANMPGTSMNWIVTPPGTANARIRVRDAAYAARVDQSDAPFAIFSGVVGVDPQIGGPTKADLRLLGRNPAAGAVRFGLDVPAAADVAVVLYDAAGRRVRELAHGRYLAGTHDLSWDGRDAQGRNCRRGVYFVRSRVGSVEATRKIVML